jgi:hypothetical protein
MESTWGAARARQEDRGRLAQLEPATIVGALRRKGSVIARATRELDVSANPLRRVFADDVCDRRKCGPRRNMASEG